MSAATPIQRVTNPKGARTRKTALDAKEKGKGLGGAGSRCGRGPYSWPPAVVPTKRGTSSIPPPPTPRSGGRQPRRRSSACSSPAGGASWPAMPGERRTIPPQPLPEGGTASPRIAGRGEVAVPTRRLAIPRRGRLRRDVRVAPKMERLPGDDPRRSRETPLRRSPARCARRIRRAGRTPR